MKVLVLNSRVPFVRGGAEALSRELVLQLRMAGHEAEEMRIPFSWNPAERLVDEMLIARNLRIENVDRVIALKFPVYLVPHPNRVVWLLHQYRQAYDLFDAGMSNIPDDASGEAIRGAIRLADEEAFRSARRLFAISEAAKRLSRYHGIEAEVLSAPLNDPELFAGGPSEDFVFAGGRVNAAKRQSLLIEALRHAPGVRLVIAGPPDDPAISADLVQLARRHGVEDRVTLDLRYLPKEDIASLVNRCRASAYIPFDEDSVGYVTMEAFRAAKPVITTTDSGGVLDIVKNGRSGLVVEPTAEALGAAMTALVSNRRQAQEFGEAGRDILDACNFTWETTLKKLLA
ncbi:glycosyltransferase [Bosea caraganae]|uniref:Glycosyltransferase n=1 Tax=Bosea caraganae TaxID=2763117 RepID=A0A370L8D6_9HYPH|nr:glycosyltransferase family 4 protein [Bosea caraganae]RDJ25197.1 glycosyltransferase [Bosea caraganae]RDJ26307.1 glycosyltransferase [Bosea caraganae]